MASYRDPQLVPTLKDLIDNSDSPENLHICVCWQHNPEDENIENFLNFGFDIADSTHDGGRINLTYKNAKILLLSVNYLKTKGACWARNMIQQEYKKEKYTLQLDSHHRFIKGWDSTVIEMLENLRDESPKPLLTAYIPSFDPTNDPAARVQEAWQMNFDRFIPEGAVFFIPSTMDDWRQRKRPMRGRFYSAHFAFADGTFAEEVQHDPEYFFHGEEISIAARAYTHGYDIYYPHKVIAWHEYTRKNRIKIWDDHGTDQKKKGNIDLDWVERNNKCHLRNKTLFGMDGLDPKSIDFGKYGFGNVRTLRDYEEYAGLSFEYRSVQQNTLNKVEPESFVGKKYDSETAWRDSMTKSNDHRILIHKNELPKDVSDYNFWYVGCHDKDGNEVFRKDKIKSEIDQLLANSGEWLDFRLIYLSNNTATTYTVWPHSASKGWMNKITKQINE